MSGVFITDFDQAIWGDQQSPGPGTVCAAIRYHYRLRVGDALPAAQLVQATDQDSWADLATALQTSILATFDETTSALYTWQLQGMELYKGANTDRMASAVLRGNDVAIQFDTLSKLVLQNRTLATTTGAESDRHDIANNPLIGKLYEVAGNGFHQRYIDATASYVTFTGRPA